MCLFGEEQLNLKTKRPRAALVRPYHVVECLNVGIHCLPPDVQDLAAAATQRYRPLIPGGSFPICCDDGRAGKIPAMREVVVDKRLHQELVNAFSIDLTPNRSHVGDQNTDQPRALNGKDCGGKSRAVLAGAQAAITCGGK